MEVDYQEVRRKVHEIARQSGRGYIRTETELLQLGIMAYQEMAEATFALSTKEEAAR